MKMNELCPRRHVPNFRLSGGHRTCRECDRERSRRRWKTPERRAYQYQFYKNNYERVREEINRLKMRPCTDCGVQYSPWVMQFDHRDPYQKEFTIGVSINRKTLDQLIAEAQKCDVVCANCHCERTHRNGDLMKRLRAEGRARIKS